MKIPSSGSYYIGRPTTQLYFAGKVLAVTDRVGSVLTNTVPPGKYYPYGEEYTASPQNTEKFGTYFRDQSTVLDYARNRYYSSIMGRFLTPDPSKSDAMADPGQWNKYAYAGGDPVNFNDVPGLFMSSAGSLPPSMLPGTPSGGGFSMSWNSGDPLADITMLMFGSAGGGGQPHPLLPLDPAFDPDRHAGSPCANRLAVNFIKSHLSDAQALAKELNVPVQFVLAVSEDESTYGTSNVAKKAFNFFGIWAGGANSTGTYTTVGGTPVSSYNRSEDPYFASGQDFVNAEIKNTGAVGATNANQFFTAIHNKFGLGSTTVQYVDKLTKIANMTILRINCP